MQGMGGTVADDAGDGGELYRMVRGWGTVSMNIF